MASLQYVFPSSLQLWRDVIDSMVSHSLWLRALLGLPEKETVYLDVPEEQGQTLCSHVSTQPSLSLCPDSSGDSTFHTLPVGDSIRLICRVGPATVLSAARIWDPEVTLVIT